MNIQFVESDCYVNEIEKTGKTKFNENVVILKKESRCFRKFDGFIRSNGNEHGTKMSLMDVQYMTDPDYDGHPADFLILKVFGGKNGCGKWIDYLSDIQCLFRKFGEAGLKAWMVDLDNDCADDVFYMTMCVR